MNQYDSMTGWAEEEREKYYKWLENGKNQYLEDFPEETIRGLKSEYFAAWAQIFGMNIRDTDFTMPFRLIIDFAPEVHATHLDLYPNNASRSMQFLERKNLDDANGAQPVIRIYNQSNHEEEIQKEWEESGGNKFLEEFGSSGMRFFSNEDFGKAISVMEEIVCCYKTGKPFRIALDYDPEQPFTVVRTFIAH